MTKTNRILTRAQTDKHDEIITTYDNIEREMPYYENFFKNKIILCNCNDNRDWSQFAKYFENNYKKYQLARLICIAYNPDSHGIASIYDGVSWKDIVLDGNGSFLEKECITYLQIADIIITSPTRKLFHEYMEQLFSYEKKFILIGNINNVTFTDIFRKFMDGKIKFGFTTPKQFVSGNGTDAEIVKFGHMAWYTNLNIKPKRRLMALNASYQAGSICGLYPELDNFKAIYVSGVREIPFDYAGLMAVPINYLLVHNPDQFDIVGEVNHGKDDPLDLCEPKLNGETLFKRIIIKNKNPF